MEKSYWVFVEGTRVMLTSGMAYKNWSSLQNSVHADFILNLLIRMLHSSHGNFIIFDFTPPQLSSLTIT